MTQDQCLDNGHQTASSSHSANDKTSDEPNKSNNSIFKSGINTAQEFNVDVNSERIDQQGADVLLVRNFALDADKSSTDKVIATTKNSLDLTTNLVNSTDNIDLNASDNGIATEMTVITHQSSDENIREIISLPEDLNKIPNDSQVKIDSKLINDKNHNKQNLKDKNTPRSKSDFSNSNENDKPEDPIERLNKLRASISSALSEVKGVLKQYSTDQSLDGESESAPASKPADDGPVRFRFVRKIRRRSVFSEDIEDVIAQKNIAAEEKTVGTLSMCKPDTEACSTKESPKLQNEESILPYINSEKLHSADESKDNSKDSKSTNLDFPVVIVPVLANNEKVRDIKPIDNEKNLNVGSSPKTESLQKDLTNDNNNKDNSSHVVSKKIKLAKEKSNINIIDKPPSDAVKTQNPKKIIKKVRRASVTLDNTSSQLNLKAQRRPSDSGTIVKHPTKIKSKTSDKIKSITEVSSIIKPNTKEESSGSNNQVTNKQDAEVQKVNAISNNFGFSKEDACSKSFSEIAIQNENRTESSDIVQAMKNLNDTLDVKALLEPSKLNNILINKEEKTDAVLVETVPKTHGTLTQEKQEKCVTSSNPSVGEAFQINKNLTQDTDIFLDLKANIEGDLTLKMGNNSQHLTLIKNKSETEINTSAVTKEEQKVVVLEPSKSIESTPETKGDKAELIKGEHKSAIVGVSTSVENKAEIEGGNATLVKEELKSVVVEPSNSVDNKPAGEGDNAAILKEEPKPAVAVSSTKMKKKAKRKVVIRRIKRKLSKDDTFIQVQETPSELEIEEKEIEEKDANEKVEEEVEVAPIQRKPCIKARQFEIGDIVMYAERYKKTQVKWRKAKIIERITSISYKLDIDGEEKPAHISYIKKFTDRKVNFGGKEYLEIDYAQIEEDEEKERNYSIWNLA